MLPYTRIKPVVAHKTAVSFLGQRPILVAASNNSRWKFTAIIEQEAWSRTTIYASRSRGFPITAASINRSVCWHLFLRRSRSICSPDKPVACDSYIGTTIGALLRPWHAFLISDMNILLQPSTSNFLIYYTKYVANCSPIIWLSDLISIFADNICSL